jgi:hypothetical protein
MTILHRVGWKSALLLSGLVAALVFGALMTVHQARPRDPAYEGNEQQNQQLREVSWNAPPRIPAGVLSSALAGAGRRTRASPPSRPRGNLGTRRLPGRT